MTKRLQRLKVNWSYMIKEHLINYNFIDNIAHIAQLLLKRIEDVNAQCKDQRTPLHVACSYGKPEIARLLLDRDADANAMDNKGWTPLHAVSGGKYQSQGDGARIARLLLEHGADMNRKDESNATPLHVACYHNKYEIVRLLHSTKAKADGDDGETALHGVARVKYESPEDGVRVARVLLECGIDVDARSKDDLTPLHFASDFGKLEIAQLLLDHGTNVNAKGVNGATPLHFASSCVYKSPEDGVRVALLLLERGADVDAQRDNHWTPLHYASNDGMLEVARVLLDHGANANAKIAAGDTPLHMIHTDKYESEESRVRTAQLLLERGVDVDAQRNNHATPLHLASSYGRLEVAQLFLDRGAN